MNSSKLIMKVLLVTIMAVVAFSSLAMAADVNLAAQKTYTYEAKQPASKYPDPDGVKLTDGKLAAEAFYYDPAWVGVWDVAPFVVNIDLGSSQLITEVRTHFLAGNAGTKYPEMISVCVSEDNVNWSDTISLGIFDGVPATGTMRWYAISDINFKGRWVRLSYTPPLAGTNIFIDEIEVY
jgi:hypothetical protein